MKIEPHDNDLREINEMLGGSPDSFEANRQELVRLWEAVISDCIHRSYWEALHRRVDGMMTPPPSLSDKRLSW